MTAIISDRRKNGKIDVTELKTAACGREKEILITLGGIDHSLLDGLHHGCPKCGGKDRFRAIVPEEGVLYCNQCFAKNNGDWIAALVWLTGWSFFEALEKAADYLGMQAAPTATKATASTTSPPAPMPAAPQAKAECRRPEDGVYWPATGGNPMADAMLARNRREWADTKPPIAEKPMIDAGVRIALWPLDSREPHHCFAFVAETAPEQISAVLLYRQDGRPFPATDKLQARKTHLVAGSHDGWVIVGGWDRLATADVAWCVEGVPDALALAGVLPAGHVVMTGVCGAQSRKNLPVDRLADKIVHVIGDADEPGQVGADDFAAVAARTAKEVRVIRLPYEITKTDGKDVRDFLCDGGTFGQLVDLAAAAPVVVADAAAGDTLTSQADVNEGLNDPHRLARCVLSAHFRAPCGATTLTNHLREFRRWNGRHHEILSADEIKSLIVQTAKREFDAANTAAILAAKKKGSEEVPRAAQVTTKLVGNVLQALQSVVMVPGMLRMPCWLADQPDGVAPEDVIAFKNGTLHLPGFVRGNPQPFMLHSPNFFNASSLDFDFDQNAACPTWLEFLGSLWHQDQQSIDTLQEILGYMLVPRTHLQKMFLLLGPPRAGKGVITRVLKAMLGDSTVCSPTLSSLASQFGLWPLLGKSVAIIPDARLSGRVDSVAVVERLLSITGEDAQDVERKNLPTITGHRLAVRFVMATNELPNFRDPSGAIMSRIIMLRLTRTFQGKEDRTLTDRLLTELPGIANWAMAGWARLDERGEFTQPDSAKELLSDLESMSSPITSFLAEQCIVGPEFSASVDDLFRCWKWWCEQHGRDHVGSIETFAKELRAKIPQLNIRRPRDEKGSRKKVYEGVGFRSGTAWDQFQSNAATHANSVFSDD